MRARIVLLPGDGPGPALIDIAARTLEAAAGAFGHTLTVLRDKVGGASIDAYGAPLTQEALRLAQEADAVLLGTVGGAKWARLTGDERPEAAVEMLEDELGLCAHVRPVRAHHALVGRSPLKAQYAAMLDCTLVRALTADPAVTRDAASVALGLARAVTRPMLAIAPPGKRGEAWQSSVRIAGADYPAITPTFITPEQGIHSLMNDPAHVGTVFMPTATGELIFHMVSSLSGSPGSLYDMRVRKDMSGMFSPARGEEGTPYLVVSAIGTAIAALRYALKLETEAAFVETALDNALTNKTDSGALAERVLEQIALAAAVRGQSI